MSDPTWTQPRLTLGRPRRTAGPALGKRELLAVRADLRSLADQLVREYAGALPAGTIIATVYAVARTHARAGSSGPTLLDATTRGVRRALLEEVASRTAAALRGADSEVDERPRAG